MGYFLACQVKIHIKIGYRDENNMEYIGELIATTSPIYLFYKFASS